MGSQKSTFVVKLTVFQKMQIFVFSLLKTVLSRKNKLFDEKLIRLYKKGKIHFDEEHDIIRIF